MDPKLALVQHPMYLLIEEDTQCAERTPPWGAPSIEVYLERLQRNLKTLRDIPRLKLGYEWSAVELELLANRDPKSFRTMCDLVQEGKCTFYNGTYSQPHLQILGSESNYRQFEYGAKVYSELCGSQVLTYAHQESSVHEQLPQILDAFGIPYVAMPEFFSTLVTLSEFELMYHRDYGPLLVAEDGLVDWKGIDGTEVALYVHHKARKSLGQWLEYQEMLGLQHSPSIYLEIPDLIDLDDQWMEARNSVEFVLLEEVLASAAARRPDRPKMRLFTNWSYAEGIRAEELSRRNTRAEEVVLAAEALSAIAAVLVGREPVRTDEIWKQILTAQHHDAYCFCGTELKEKSIAALIEAESTAQNLTDEAAAAVMKKIPADRDGVSIAVFNTTPQDIAGVVRAVLPGGRNTVVDPSGRTVPSSVETLASGETAVSFVAESPGLGYAVYSARESANLAIEGQSALATGPYVFENSYYKIVVEPDGTVSSLVSLSGGSQLVDGRANSIRAMDSAGVQHGPKEPAKELGQGLGAHGRPEWFSEGLGPELQWASQGAVVSESPLGATVQVRGSLATNAEAVVTVTMYHQLPYITIRWQFDFDKCSIGTFYDDQTKLRVLIPLAFEGKVHHDIPFGYVESKRERPFFPTTWTDISDGDKGLAYFHRGTPKHWVRGNVLENLFGWGEHTDAIGNRLGKNLWGKSFDQRLNGRHTIEYGLYPHAGGMSVADVARAARSYAGPLRAYATTGGDSELPSATTVLSLPDPNVIATSVQVRKIEEGVSCRLYSVAQGNSVNWHSDQLTKSGLKSLKGEDVQSLARFQIGTLNLEIKE